MTCRHASGQSRRRWPWLGSSPGPASPLPLPAPPTWLSSRTSSPARDSSSTWRPSRSLTRSAVQVSSSITAFRRSDARRKDSHPAGQVRARAGAGEVRAMRHLRRVRAQEVRLALTEKPNPPAAGARRAPVAGPGPTDVHFPLASAPAFIGEWTRQIADPFAIPTCLGRHLVALAVGHLYLRLEASRPHHRCAAKNCDERAAFHAITSGLC